MSPIDNPFFNPFSRWPFSSSSSTALISSSSPPLCSSNFPDGCTEQPHPYGKCADYQCRQCAAGFTHHSPPSPPPPAHRRNTPSRNSVEQKIGKDNDATCPAVNENTAGAPSKGHENDGTKKDVETGKEPRPTEYTHAGFFKKDDEPPKNVGSATGANHNHILGKTSATKPTSPATSNDHSKSKTADRKNTMGNRSSTQGSLSTAFSTSSDKLNGPWRRACSMSSSSETLVNPIGFDKSHQLTKKQSWKSDSSPMAPPSLKPKASSDKIGFGSSSKDSKSAVSQSTSPNVESRQDSRTTTLGCPQCIFSPRLGVIPCGCLICLGCGGKFWGTGPSDGDVHCACGGIVSSMINMEHLLQKPSPHNTHSYYAASSFNSSPTSTSVLQPQTPTPSYSIFPSWQREQVLQGPAVAVAVAQSISSPTYTPTILTTGPDMNSFLLMDAETAIQNAPFIELGRHALAQNWSCVRVGNIPYNVTGQEIIEFLGKNSNIVPEAAGSLGVHVIMDRSTGKTMDAFVEFLSPKDAWKCALRRRSHVLGNRHLTLEVVDPSELMKEIFPRAKGLVWEGVIPRVSHDESGVGSKIPEIISREELVLIVNHARTPHRSPFSRKCLQRPFQSLLSIVAKFPWFAVHIYTPQQRDYIFHALLSAVDILKRQIKRGRTMPNLDLDLLKSMVRTGVICTGFTDSQKYELVKTAEFGADGMYIEKHVAGLDGFQALGRAPGVDRRLIESYALILELSMSPYLSDATYMTASTGSFKPFNKGNPISGDEAEKAKLSMAEAAMLEWAVIEKAIRAVLPARIPYVKNLTKSGTGLWHDRH